jgi:hypothetical protein
MPYGISASLTRIYGRQCTYNVTLGRVRATIVAAGEQKVLHILCVCMCVCVSSLMYPACNAPAPYCHLWLAPLYSIFSHLLINGNIFEKKKFTEYKMCVSSFSTTFIRDIFHSKKYRARYDQKCTSVFM